jgi:excisionase family DNA binding protein
MSLPALYTAEETAAKLKVTRRAVYRWLSTGKLKGLRVGPHWRIAEEELMEFMKYGSSHPTTPKGRSPIEN